MAHSVWSAAEMTGNLVKALLDAAIIAGIGLVAGTITAETGVGAIIGYGVAAVEVANMLRLWAKITEFIQTAAMAVNGFVAALDREASGLDAAKLPSLPGGPGYDHPLVHVG
jgi:hypothetical protein